MPDDIEKDVALRRSHKARLITNPNYFGNLTKLDIPDLPKAVLSITENTSFEELTCIGHNPATDIMVAIVEVKKGTGYLGDSCQPGSHEYVRFYLDYGDGTWVDHGVASFEAHDLGFDRDLCYAVPIRIQPKRRSCCDAEPVLPKVLAILSWNVMPPPNQPNWFPVWGNRLRRVVQIKPRNPILCHIIDQFETLKITKLNPVLAATIKDQIMALDPPEEVPAGLAELVEKIDRNDKLAVMRSVFPMVAKLAENDTDIEAWQALAALKQFDIDISIFDDFIIEPKFNTEFEDLRCVGLDRDLEMLHGVIQIKRPSGYSGGLCAKGSREYIAFYLDFGSGWEYQGTTSVDVHDIPQISRSGLWYQAQLPVKLDAHKKEWCKTGRARIRGILSWSSPPPANQPEFIPYWGDRQDCFIEIRPLPKGVPEGVFKPLLLSVGNMSVTKINAAGYANGMAEGGIFGPADDAPFGGTTLLKGGAFNLPGGPISYRIRLRRIADGTIWSFTDPFDADVTTFPSVIPVTQTITPVGEWYPYLPANPNVIVTGGLMGALRGLQDGLHEVWLDFHAGTGGAHLATTAAQPFMVDNTRPTADVEITSGAGNCGKFGIGEVIHGTYESLDAHSGVMTISVTPLPEAAPGQMVITPAALPPGHPLPPPIAIVVAGGNSRATLSYGALTLATGGSFGRWELDTTGMGPCGYNVRIDVRDRAIVGSSQIGWPAVDIEGFCLEKR